MATLKQIDDAIFWHERVRAQSRDQAQRARCDERILNLMRERMELTRERDERELARGARERAAWYDTSAELT